MTPAISGSPGILKLIGNTPLVEITRSGRLRSAVPVVLEIQDGLTAAKIEAHPRHLASCKFGGVYSVGNGLAQRGPSNTFSRLIFPPMQLLCSFPEGKLM